MTAPTTIEFPWPHKLLFPNETERWGNQAQKRKLRRNARTLGWGLALEAFGRPRAWPEALRNEPVLVEVEITPPMRRGKPPDEDNLKSALKHYLDGVAAAMGVNDSKFTFAKPVWHPRSGAGKVVIRI